jgi:hypothetical protein
MMEPAQLIGPSSAFGAPAPYWFLVFFKVLGFTLHTAPMHLWFAGTIVALLLGRSGAGHAQLLSARLLRRMPIVIAYGVNFGIVPLLFTQVAYYKVFYPATILMAWPWFSIFVLLTLAYYGVYIYAAGLHNGTGMTRLRNAGGWMAAVLFLTIGFLFSNAFSLMVNVAAWPQLWLASSVAGASVGTALNLGDPTLWPRWLMMFGLALTTTAAYVGVDTGLFAGGEPAAYRQWARSLALKLYSFGLLWFGCAGLAYVATWPVELRDAAFGGWRAVLMVVTAVAPGLPWLLLLRQSRSGGGRALAWTIGFAQFGVLALNAVSRQVVQNLQLRGFVDVTSEPVTLQWSPLLSFLGLFVAGLAVMAWMLSRVIAATRRGPAHGRSAEPGPEVRASAG